VSHCANYVLRFDGEQRVGNTRWGAVALPENVFYGPDHTLAFLLEVLDDESTAFPYNELMCEAGVFADYDAKRLLVCGGEDLRSDVLLQHAYISMLRRTWTSWQVAWAYGGWHQIANEAGVPLEPVPRSYHRPVTKLEPFKEGPGWRAPIDTRDYLWNRGAGYIAPITIRDERGVRDHAVMLTGEQAIPTGERIIDMLASVTTIEPSPALNAAWTGLVIDTTTRTVAYWQGRELESVDAPALADVWPGWTVVLDDRGIEAHFRRTGRDPSVVAIDPRIVREVVANVMFLGMGGGGIGALVDEIRERAKAPNVTTAPGALRTPPTGRLSPDERRAFVAQVLAELAEPD
jgi:hypothetical protein